MPLRLRIACVHNKAQKDCSPHPYPNQRNCLENLIITSQLLHLKMNLLLGDHQIPKEKIYMCLFFFLRKRSLNIFPLELKLGKEEPKVTSLNTDLSHHIRLLCQLITNFVEGLHFPLKILGLAM